MIQAGSEVIAVPARALLHPDRLPAAFRRRLRPSRATTHGLLAAFMTVGDADDLTRLVGPWSATWPSTDDFKATTPLLLTDEFRRENVERKLVPLLPPQVAGEWPTPNGIMMVQGTLAKQEARFERDWRALCATPGLPPLDRQQFQYYWLIVNTRSFYFDHGSLAKVKDKDDRMVLCPFIDFFNHADQGVRVALESSKGPIAEKSSVSWHTIRADSL